MLRNLVLLTGVLLSLSAVSSQAQEAVLGQLYGNGVHAYFAGDFVKSYDQLTSAITAGSSDPRVYYYRGLAYLKLGREQEAVQDFQKGAELESKDLNRSYNVARSLERVQGALRQQLETYRINARRVALEEANKVRKARFEAIQREEERVLRHQATQAAPTETIATPEGQSGEKAIETNLFGNPQEANDTMKGSDEKEEKSADQPEATETKPDDAGPFGSGENAEKEVKGNAEKEVKEAEQPIENMTAEPPTATKKSGPIKTSILGALIKGSKEGIKKSVGEKVGGLGGMLPMGKSAPGGSIPGGTTPPGGGATPGVGPDPFGSGSEEKAPSPEKPEAKASPFKEEPAPGKSNDPDPFGN